MFLQFCIKIPFLIIFVLSFQGQAFSKVINRTNSINYQNYSQYISPHKDVTVKNNYPKNEIAQNGKDETVNNSNKDGSTPTQLKKDKTLGQKMVEFIRGILGEKPKPIKEELVRDDL